jgi:hypothetical protein
MDRVSVKLISLAAKIVTGKPIIVRRWQCPPSAASDH